MKKNGESGASGEKVRKVNEEERELFFYIIISEERNTIYRTLLNRNIVTKITNK